MPLSLEQKVDLLWDKLAISEVMNTFGRALDSHDWGLYECCLCEEFEVDFERLTGSPPVRTTASLFTRFAEVALSPLTAHHQYSNNSITINGDEATGVIYMVARHLSPVNNAWNTQYGWYENTFVRSDTKLGWQISRLKHDYQWTSGTSDLIDLSTPEAQHVMKAVFG